MTPTPTHMLTGAAVNRVVWVPGADLLHGTCHCGDEHRAEDPVTLWEWFLTHHA